jgi:hypothetical protein
MGLFYSLSLAQANEKRMNGTKKRKWLPAGEIIREGGTLLGLSIGRMLI